MYPRIQGLKKPTINLLTILLDGLGSDQDSAGLDFSQQVVTVIWEHDQDSESKLTYRCICCLNGKAGGFRVLLSFCSSVGKPVLFISESHAQEGETEIARNLKTQIQNRLSVAGTLLNKLQCQPQFKGKEDNYFSMGGVSSILLLF